MPYLTIKIEDNFDNDVKKEAEKLELTPAQVLERRFYGCPEYEAIAGEAKEALGKYSASEEIRYAMIKAWIEAKTAQMGQKLVVEYDIIFKLKGE